MERRKQREYERLRDKAVGVYQVRVYQSSGRGVFVPAEHSTGAPWRCCLHITPDASIRMSFDVLLRKKSELPGSDATTLNATDLPDLHPPKCPPQMEIKNTAFTSNPETDKA